MIYYECDGINAGQRCGKRVVMAGTSLVRPNDWAEMTIAMGLKPSVVKHMCPRCVENEQRRARGEAEIVDNQNTRELPERPPFSKGKD